MLGFVFKESAGDAERSGNAVIKVLNSHEALTLSATRVFISAEPRLTRLAALEKMSLPAVQIAMADSTANAHLTNGILPTVIVRVITIAATAHAIIRLLRNRSRL